MPKRRRPVRPVRRPNFQPAPEPSPEGGELEDDEPSFADAPVGAIPGIGTTGPVETRPHWNARNERVQGRRLAQLRRSSGEERGPPRSSSVGMLPTFAAGYIRDEIRQILLTTGAMIALLVVLTFVLR